MTRTWTLTIEERPFTVNASRRMHHHELAKHVKRWRRHGRHQTEELDVPALAAITVTSTPHRETRRSLPDVAAEAGAVKALVDGIVDAGVIPDDKPAHMRSLTYNAPVIDGWDGIELTITAVE